MLNRVAFTMYPVTDMAAARDFYEGHLADDVGRRDQSMGRI